MFKDMNKVGQIVKIKNNYVWNGYQRLDPLFKAGDRCKILTYSNDSLWLQNCKTKKTGRINKKYIQFVNNNAKNINYKFLNDTTKK